jgi:hypothetical protein
MLTVLAWIGAGLGLALLLVLLVPFGVRADGRVSEDELAGSAELRWLFGLIVVRFATEGRSGFYLAGLRVARFPRRATRPEPDPEPEPEPEPERARGRRGIRWLIRSRRGLSRAGLRLLAATQPRLEVRGRIGVGDPADTALVAPLIAQLGRLPGVHLHLTWCWVDEVLDLEGRAGARIWIAQLLGLGLLLLFDGEVRRLLRAPA